MFHASLSSNALPQSDPAVKIKISSPALTMSEKIIQNLTDPSQNIDSR